MPANKNGMNWIRQDLRLAIYLRDGHTCVYCFRTRDEVRMTLDHVKPRSQGGSNGPENLVTACLDCNTIRGNTPLETFVLSQWELRGWDVLAKIKAALDRGVDRKKAREVLALRRALDKRRVA